MSSIVILDPRGKISLGGYDVINRHKNYGRHLASISNKLKLVVMTSSNSKLMSNNSKYLDEYLLSKPTFNSLIFAWRASRCIKQEKMNVKLLIAGDPWESFWCALLLNKFMRIKIPIQVQIHGDIADPLWRRINVKNRIRFILAKMFCKKASAVRAVGKSQKMNLIKNLGIVKSIVSVIPVPISLKSLDLREIKSINRPSTIAIIGRIHKDRGIDYFLQLLEKLALVSDNFNVILIGGGKDETDFLTSVRKIVGPNKVKLVGQVSQRQLSRYWQKIGVLVSLAPVESYGLVMREALVSGVPVWALESSGSKDLLLESRTGQIRLLNLESTPDSLLIEFNKLLKTKPNIKFKNKFMKENAKLPHLLVKSWMGLIKI
jgi:glycosyltransferase involved in cell wall biosynthesis